MRSARKDVLIRVCTRAPVFAPERFTPHLKALLKSFKPLWIIPHINHSAEFSPQFSPESYRVLNDLIDCGIPMQSQTVLLRGVNNNIEELVSLFQGLTEIGIKPGYLFQGDLAPGTAHFRVPIDEGIKLYERLRYELSGLSLPVYAVDIPGGGGKFNLLNLDPAAAGVCAERPNTRMFLKPNGALHTPIPEKCKNVYKNRHLYRILLYTFTAKFGIRIL